MTKFDASPAPTNSADGCCGGGPDEPCSHGRGLSRRMFLGVGAGALLASALPASAIAVPADKRLDPNWLAGIAARGDATRWSGAALDNIGMPVGGAATGQVYLAGDGRLWLWDVFNADNAYYGGADFTGPHYAVPLDVVSPFASGFAVRAQRRGGRTVTAALDRTGFPATTFAGRYPLGSVAYRGGDVPAEIDLDVFSPFVPTNVADSELPATVLEYTVRNTGTSTIDYELVGFSENPVCLRSRTQQPVTLEAAHGDVHRAAAVQFSAASTALDEPTGDDIVFEDWSGAGFGSWTVTGDAFGPGPVAEADLPPEMLRFGALGTTGGRIVTSYAFRATGTGPDDHRGTLRSPDFTISRNGIMTRVGGGYGPGLRVAVVVDGTEVASATGLRSEPLRPVFFDVSAYRGKTAHLEIVDDQTGFWAHISCDRIVFTDRTAPAADRIFEDWSSGSYANWTVSGRAFGSGPVTEAQTPDYFRRGGPLMTLGTWLVTSHDFREFTDAGAADGVTGTLTSRTFTIDHRYLLANIGGGSDATHVGLRVVVDGQVVARLAGDDAETLALKAVDLSPYLGRTAHLEIVDDATGGWGHVNCDRIWFSDLPLRLQSTADLRDGGTFALAALDPSARSRPSISRWSEVDDWFDAPEVAAHQTDNGQAGAVSVRFTLKPGKSRTVRFAIGWNFPRLSLAKFNFIAGADALRHHYATRFPTAAAVLDHVSRRVDDLSSTTHTFVDTWYRDTTLPNWFVERTFAPASTLSTETCQYFDTGRFYAWEGSYCCVGTCTHVWNYAQSIAYLFPELERSARTVTDYGVAFHADTGAIDYRGEGGRSVAHDGQCGNILRTYREHQMSTSDDFLRSIWPQVKKATQYLIGHDGSPANGIFETDQYNTLDATWYGEIPWISGLYVAALHAAAEMALDMGDETFARQCRTIAAAGSDYLDDMLWNEKYQYFEQKIDPNHRDATNSNRGCYIDQMFGQTYAHQLGLDPVFDPAKADTALHSLWRNNFMPDARAYMGESGIQGGREFSTDGEAGTLMCTWPFGGADEAPGAGAPSSVAYFNEVWTGTEWQFAAHLLHAGQVDEGLAVARAIYDRYSADKRNPYNEIECSDHYARSMMSHATYLAALGFEHHGPRGHLGFAPRIDPDAFRAGFTVGAGWGTFWQQRDGADQRYGIELRYGRLDGLRTLALDVRQKPRSVRVVRAHGGTQTDVRVGSWALDGSRLVITFRAPVSLKAGQTLAVRTA